MQALAMNGMTFSIEHGSLNEKSVETGDRGRAVDGTPWAIVHSTHAIYEFKSIWMTIEEATWWKALFSSQGFTAGFETDVNTDQGHVAVAVPDHGTLAVQSTDHPVAPGTSLKSLLISRNSVPTSWRISNGHLSGTNNNWTVVYRIYQSVLGSDAVGVLAHSASTTGTTLYGNPYGQVMQSGASASYLDFWADTNHNSYIDNLFFVNAILPASLRTELGTFLYLIQIPQLPLLRIQGEITGGVTYTGQARCTGSSFKSTMNGVYEKLSVEVTLE